METKEKVRFRIIDILRGGSALAVTLFHFNEPYPVLHDPYHVGVKWGWLGVSVFFVLSGFCISSARIKDTPLVFWEKRGVRIYPAYWASLLVVLAVVAFRILTTGTNDVTPVPKSLSDWLYTVAALNSPASAIPAMNWVYWSLGYEVAFYILMGLLFLRKSAVPVVGFSLLALLFSSFGFPFDQWGLFGLGVSCHLFVAHRWRSAVFLAAICLWHTTIALSVVETVVGLLAAILILFPPMLVSSALFEPLRRVGLFSYSLYLTHVPVGCYFVPYYLQSTFTRELSSSILQDAVLLTGCLLFSYAFYRVVEKPTHELARQIGLRNGSAHSTPASIGRR